METADKIILVTGATGHQGGAVVKHLLADGWKVRAMSRHSDHAEARALKESGVEVVKGDFDVPSTLDEALKGVYGVFSVQQPLDNGVDREIKEGKALADAAKSAGVKHFIYSSYGAADRQPGVPFIDSKWEIEEHIRNLGLNWTIFRPVYFMENLLQPEVRDSVYNGVLPLALDPEMPLQLISVDDIGAFVALAFKNPDKYKGKALEIAGDELTGNQIAEILSRKTGRKVEFQQLDIDKVREFGADFAMLFDWLNIQGFSADIPKVRELYPDIKSFDSWASESGWHKAAA
ncbi:MAG: NmrA/HSCARG family protein [Fibrobacter sp.]|nr:NmrA/HSCARG family protein [Fibrobacter sp.]